MRIGFNEACDVLAKGGLHGITDQRITPQGFPVRMGTRIFVEQEVVSRPDDGPVRDVVVPLSERISPAFRLLDTATGYTVPVRKGIVVPTGIVLALPVEYYATFNAAPSIGVNFLSYVGSRICENDLGGGEVLLPFINLSEHRCVAILPGDLLGYIEIRKIF